MERNERDTYSNLLSKGFEVLSNKTVMLQMSAREVTDIFALVVRSGFFQNLLLLSGNPISPSAAPSPNQMAKPKKVHGLNCSL